MGTKSDMVVEGKGLLAFHLILISEFSSNPRVLDMTQARKPFAYASDSSVLRTARAAYF